MSYEPTMTGLFQFSTVGDLENSVTKSSYMAQRFVDGRVRGAPVLNQIFRVSPETGEVKTYQMIYIRGHASHREMKCTDYKSIKIISNNRPPVTTFRCLAVMPPRGSMRVGILPGHPSLDRRRRKVEVGVEPRTFSSARLMFVNLRHLWRQSGISLNFKGCASRYNMDCFANHSLCVSASTNPELGSQKKMCIGDLSQGLCPPSKAPEVIIALSPTTLSQVPEENRLPSPPDDLSHTSMSGVWVFVCKSFCIVEVGETAQWSEREFTDRKARGSNPTFASQLPLSWFRKTGSIPAVVFPSGSMTARHRKGATVERFFC
ncbi:hypothetical protein T265_03289 [Opisthorchis viverrini]|uniref:Uncharacterized protein n=1 Tax=Opisthorchis viverrini TaxID=6198 RepID=A0A074ZWH1_OPIVI|nr:hypothetical protein T265_03289 [Opisthorchis viverrini]KER30232.1 hypothetical protein T265_03289 [Opisthorchis viverrini]